MRALFVTDRHDAPYRYRCVHGAAQLRAAGAIANLRRLDDPKLLTSLDRYSVIVLFRLPFGRQVETLVERARSAGIPLVFDVDDLIFDPEVAPLLPFRRGYTPAQWAKTYGAELAKLRRTFDACQAFIGSTPGLAEWARHLGKPAFVHPNVVPDEYLALAPWLERLAPRLRRGNTIGYFSGSNTHDFDFAHVAPALRSVLERAPGTRLLITGFLDTRNALDGLEHRVVRLPHLDYRALAWAYAACDVTIAPLCEINAFTNGKSALKFFEPGAFGVPVVASPIAQMRAAIEHGRSGWLADSEEDWVSSLEAALDPETRDSVGARAQSVVRERHSSQALAGKLAALLAEIARPDLGKTPKKLPIPRRASRWPPLHDVARVYAALREPIDPGLGRSAARALVEAILSGDAPPELRVLIARSPTASGWNAQGIDTGSTALGEHRLTGADPHYVSPLFDLESRRYRFAILHLRAANASGRGRTQLFWQPTRWQSFNERDSVAVPIAADGVDATYVIDLWKSEHARFWRRRVGGVRFRFDPLEGAGSARISVLALVPEGVMQIPPLTPESALCLPKDSRAARHVLHDALERLPLWIETPQRPLPFRKWLARELAGTGAAVERLEKSETGVHVARRNSLSVTGVRVSIRRTGEARPPGVDIVVPVHNARVQTLRCLRSVLLHARGDFRLVVIDDASTDPKLWPALERIAASNRRVLLLQNPENLGFVGTAKRGFSLAQGRDVLLLNSDTRVFRGFFGRLRACAYSDARTGIVCPLSNNATICSVPEFCRPNTLPDGMRARQMAELVANSSRARFPELVTPVGFCMYVRAGLLARIGDFDAERFGRGFGEENDLGERAKAAGFRIRLADDVWVWHEGKASFGAEGLALENANSRVLEEKHPGYHAAVAHFIEQNPLAPIHAELAFHLARFSHRRERAVMMLLHASPFSEPCGGTEYVVRDLVKQLRLPRVILAYPGDFWIEVAELQDGNWSDPSIHRFALKEPIPRVSHDHAPALEAFSEVLELFRVGHVHIHHLLGWPLSIGRALERANIPYTLTVHDFYGVCPSPNLLNVRTNELCCPESGCNPERTRACLAALFAELPQSEPDSPLEFLAEHRALFGELFSKAACVFFPSASAAGIVGTIHSIAADRSRVLPHAYWPARTDGHIAHRQGPLRVALLGEVSYPSKGSAGYLEVIQRLRGQPIEWHIFGATNRFDFERRLSRLEPAVRIVRHGSYARDEVVELLQRARVDVGLLLPIWPETFSLTLSELLAAKIPVVASRQGSLGERLDRAAYAFLVDSPAEAAEKIAELARDRARLAPLVESVARIEPPKLDAWLEAHRAHYAEHSATAPVSPLRRRDYQRLSSTRVDRAQPAHRSVSTREPAARHRSARWYQTAERLKLFLPESMRALARGVLSDERFRSLQRIRIPSRRALAGNEVSIEARYLNTARFSSLGPDPCFFIDIDPIAPEQVSAIRFNVWCSHHGYTYAQIYWRHDDELAFSEAKSLTVELHGSLGDWQTYVVRLDPKSNPSFFSGKKLVGLRFDPVNYAGLFCVGELVLCGRAD